MYTFRFFQHINTAHKFNTGGIKMRNVHQAGRPPIQRPKSFYVSLLQEYERHSIRQLAGLYGVCPQTISNWLKKAKREVNENVE